MALEFASRKATFPNYRKFETTFAGRPFVVETGKLCGLANGSAMIRYGETCVLCNVTMSEKPREGVDFFPLSVEFEEKLYAAGRIPGSFMRREGRPGEHAILSSRVVDRPIRPLFPKDMRNDVCVTMTVMSLDPDCSPEIAGMNGASLAIAMSDIPWNGPIGGVAVGYVDGEIVLNPTKEQRERSDLALTLAASMEKIVMIEAGANEVTEEVMMDAIKAGHEEIKKLLTFMNGIVAEIGKPKKSFTPVELDHALLADVYAKHLEDVKAAMNTDDKNVRDAAMLPIMNGEYVVPVFISEDGMVSYLDLYSCAEAGYFCITEPVCGLTNVEAVTERSANEIAAALEQFIFEQSPDFSRVAMGLYEGEGFSTETTFPTDGGTQYTDSYYLGFDSEREGRFLYQISVDDVGIYFGYEGKCTYLGMNESGMIFACRLYEQTDGASGEAISGAFLERRRNDWNEKTMEWREWADYRLLNGYDLFGTEGDPRELEISAG